MPVEHDPFAHIVNVHWDEERPIGFLYSGTDGMHGSEDGEKWTKAKSPVPATSLAWIDNVWIGCDGDKIFRSEDGAETWEVVSGPELRKVAACKIKSEHTDDPEEQSGIFAGYEPDFDNDLELIYISRDLGKTWSLALSIPTIIPFGDNEDGYENFLSLSGCGDCIFVSTIKGESRYANGDGMVYCSKNDGGFSREQVWTGTNHIPPDDDPHTLVYSTGGVGFDETTQTYSLTGLKEEGFGPGGALGSEVHYSIIYATSSSGKGFSGEHTIVQTQVPALASEGERVRGPSFTVGGGGKFLTTIRRDHFIGIAISAELQVHFFNGGAGVETLRSIGDIFQGLQIGPVCWKNGEEETDGTAPGTFACIAFTAGAGGVYIAKDGAHFVQTHFATVYEDLAAIAVGDLSWLEPNTA